MVRHWSERPDRPALADAIRLRAKGRKGTPTEDDRPRPKLGKRPKLIRGQVDIFGAVVGESEDHEQSAA
jgi:hypothetical protein